MKVSLTAHGCTLTREPGDKRISHESTVVFHMRNLLNALPAPIGNGADTKTYNTGPWRRIYPDRYGLNSCKLGLASKGNKTFLWHERYAIEDAAEEFNKSGYVFFSRVDAEPAAKCEWQTETGTINSPRACGKPAKDGYIWCAEHIRFAKITYPHLPIPREGEK